MSKKLNIAINGFGRIGRALTKINEEFHKFNLVLINDLNPNIENLAYLLRYDSTYGNLNSKIKISKKNIFINNKKIEITSNKNIEKLILAKYNVDILIDASGVNFSKNQYLNLLKKQKLKKIIITHSSSNSDIEIIMGLNESKLKDSHSIISSSICDANAISHIVKFIDDNYEINTGNITTLHHWLSYQNLVDGSSLSVSNPSLIWDDFALGRASANNIIPKNTTAVKAIEKVLPKIKNKLSSFSYRTPTDIVCSADLTFFLKKKIALSSFKKKIINQFSNSKYFHINNESLVSIDYKKMSQSLSIDMKWICVNKNMVKVILWYDNEWGFSNRVYNLLEMYKK